MDHKGQVTIVLRRAEVSKGSTLKWDQAHFSLLCSHPEYKPFPSGGMSLHPRLATSLPKNEIVANPHTLASALIPHPGCIPVQAGGNHKCQHIFFLKKNLDYPHKDGTHDFYSFMIVFIYLLFNCCTPPSITSYGMGGRHINLINPSFHHYCLFLSFPAISPTLQLQFCLHH